MTFLFNFKVGVSSPPSIENYTGRIENLWMLCARDIALELAIEIPSSINFLKFSHWRASFIFFALEPLALIY